MFKRSNPKWLLKTEHIEYINIKHQLIYFTESTVDI